MRAVLQIVLNAVALWLASQLPIGVHYRGSLPMLLLAGLVLGLINLLVRPIVTLLSLPMIILTLGLFFIVINGLMLWLAALLMPHHLRVDGCGAAILGGLVIAVFNWVVRAFVTE